MTGCSDNEGDFSTKQIILCIEPAENGWSVFSKSLKSTFRFVRHPDAKGAELAIGRLKAHFDQIGAKGFGARGNDDFLDAAFAKKIRLLNE